MAKKKPVGKAVGKSAKTPKPKAKKNKYQETESAKLIKKNPSKIDLGEPGVDEAPNEGDDVPEVLG